MADWSHELGHVTCPHCGEETSNPFDSALHETIFDESEDIAVCEECDGEFWVTAHYRAQFRFATAKSDHEPREGSDV